MMSRPIDRALLLKKIQDKHRTAVLKDAVISQLDFLEYPNHKTAIYTISNVENPDQVMIYTYGGFTPHLFHNNDDGLVDELGSGQFTWEWMRYWLDQGIAIVIFDMPDYFKHSMFVPSLYRLTPDRKRESFQVIELAAKRFPGVPISWFGFSYGAIDAAIISLEKTQLSKVILSSGTWHTLENYDIYHQGARLDWYDVTNATVPVLIAQHQTEKFEKATEQMSKTDSITIASDISQTDGHFFRGSQPEVVDSVCNWLRGNEYKRVIL